MTKPCRDDGCVTASLYFTIIYDIWRSVILVVAFIVRQDVMYLRKSACDLLAFLGEPYILGLMDAFLFIDLYQSRLLELLQSGVFGEQVALVGIDDIRFRYVPVPVLVDKRPES